MSEEYFVSPHHDIEAAFNALNAIESQDVALSLGKRAEARIRRNALFIIDKALQEIAGTWEEDTDPED